MKYPYFRSLEADRYSFYRVPKALIKVDLFEKMSGDAKLLYAVLLDRMNLSLKNGWQDENGNAYIICTIDEIMDSIRCARQKAVKLLDELEHEYAMSVFFMDFDMAPSVIWARDLYDQMQIRSDFRKWFPRMCQYGFVEGRDYEFVPRVRPQDEGGRTVQRYVKDYRITLEMAKQLYKLHHFHKNDCFRSCEGQHCMGTDHWMQAVIELLHQHKCKSHAPPKRFYESQPPDSLVTTTQIAKEYGCGAKVFNRLLHLHGIQYRANNQWVLYAKHQDKGYTANLVFRLHRSDGSAVEKLHTAWTHKGRKFLYHELKRRGILPMAEQES